MRTFCLVLVTMLIVSCTSHSGNEIRFTNPIDQPAVDAGVVITRKQLAEAGEIPENLLPVIRINGEDIPCQPDDLDGDGAWDELFVLISLGPSESRNGTIVYIGEEEYPEYERRTNIRFARKDMDYKEVREATRETHAINTETQKVWQMEGIAWENDRIGFRNYFDRRNGMDIFGKVSSLMVLDSVGDKDHPDYHTFNPDWGVDVLKVGNSLGAGSIAIRYKDSLYRVGDNGMGTCEILAEGPLRSIFRLKFKGWKMADLPLDITHDVIIEAGKNYYSSKVTIEGTEAPILLVTGIVNMKSKELHAAKSAEGTRAFYTYDLQSEDTTLLGMSIMIPDDLFAGTGETPGSGDGITETYTVQMNVEPGSLNHFRFYAAWEREDPRWQTADGFARLLTSESERMASPVTFSIQH